MRRFLYANGLSIAFLVLFLAALTGQSIAGFAAFNDDQTAALAPSVSFGRFVTSSTFATDVLENWQSEYLQFSLYILGTIWLLQRGSPESKDLGDEGTESDERQGVGRHAGPDAPLWARVGGLRTRLYSNSLLVVMTGIWFASWTAQAIAGRAEYNARRLDSHQAPLAFVDYLGSGDFWNRTLQNWQSEFLAVGSMAILAVYLRQRGSPESKPVGASHAATSVEG